MSTANPANHPFSKTKRLSRSITAGRIKQVNQFAISGTVEAGGPQAPYAGYVHNGTRPHVIRARPDNPTGMLRFLWVKHPSSSGNAYLQAPPSAGARGVLSTRGASSTHFVGPRVNHPGSRPKPFLIVAAREVFGVEAVRR